MDIQISIGTCVTFLIYASAIFYLLIAKPDDNNKMMPVLVLGVVISALFFGLIELIAIPFILLYAGIFVGLKNGKIYGCCLSDGWG